MWQFEQLHFLSKNHPYLFNPFSKRTVISKNSIPREISQIKMATSQRVLGSEIVDPMKGTASHAADRLIDNPESARSHGLSNFISFYPSIFQIAGKVFS